MKFETEIRPLDLGQTLGCGQTFRWDQLEQGVWKGVVGKHSVILKQSQGAIAIETPSRGADAVRAVRVYLRAEDNIPVIQKTLSKDDVLSKGMRRFRGLRIVKMDEWECLISYALATYANIPRIRKMVGTICSRYGERIAGGTYSFPSVRRLSEASEKELFACGLGYRAKYVTQLCSTLSETDIASMRRLRYPELKRRLMELPGVGDKVADCVSLFGFGKLDAFPIDIWIERALSRLYNVKGSHRKLAEFAAERFGEYAGYAQEYLYFNERMRNGEFSCAFSE